MRDVSLARFKDWLDELKLVKDDPEMGWRKEILIDALKWGVEKLPENEQQEARKLCDGLVNV